MQTWQFGWKIRSPCGISALPWKIIARHVPGIRTWQLTVAPTVWPRPWKQISQLAAFNHNNPLPQFDSHNGVTHDTNLKKGKYHIKYPMDLLKTNSSHALIIHYTAPAHPQRKETGAPNSRNYKSIKNYNQQIHLMHYTSPAHPQEKKQEYQIDYPQRLVLIYVVYHHTRTTPGRRNEPQFNSENCRYGAWQTLGEVPALQILI